MKQTVRTQKKASPRTSSSYSRSLLSLLRPTWRRSSSCNSQKVWESTMIFSAKQVLNFYSKSDQVLCMIITRISTRTRQMKRKTLGIKGMMLTVNKSRKVCLFTCEKYSVVSSNAKVFQWVKERRSLRQSKWLISIRCLILSLWDWESIAQAARLKKSSSFWCP